MSGHSPLGPSKLSPPLGNIIVNNVTPVLRMVKDSVSGLPVPGLEAAVGSATAILETVQTMQNNKEDLRKLREDLDGLKRNINNASVDKSTNEQVRRLIQTVKDLKAIIATCDKLRESRKIKRFIQAKRISNQIANVRQSVRDILQVFQVFSIISIENNVGIIKDTVTVTDTNVATIGGNVIAIDSKVEDSKRFAILSELKRAGARFDANDTPSGCMDGTRVELLEELVGHVKGITSAPTSQFVLVCGIPGSGKSTIAKSVAIRLANQHLLAASFFFSRNHATRREITLVFSTIAFQLAQYNIEYGDILANILERDADLANAAPSDQLEKLIIHPLSQLETKEKRPWIILLDALDECGSDRGDTLLELLLSPTAKFPDHVRFFLTGRPEDPILSAFKQPSIQPITHMHTLNTTLEASVSQDIGHYLRQSLSGKWRGWHGWKVKDDDLDMLVTRAGGLFIFASTAVKYIRGYAAKYDPQIAMDFILRGVDQSTRHILDQLYLNIINDAIPMHETEFVARYLRVLGAVIHLQEPQSVTAIAELLGLTSGDVFRIITPLKSVLLVSKTVRIAHLSFSEYITGAIYKDRPDLLISGPSHHTDLANSSIRHMNDKLHRNICSFNPPDSYKFNVDLPHPLVPIPPSLRYACMYWASHLLESDIVGLMTKELENGLENWLDTTVLFWLEVLSICDELSRAIHLIAVAQVWYRKHVTTTSSTHCAVLLSDASRFIAAFYDTISRAAGHIFYSALPFTPPSSELSRTYNRPPGEFVRVIKGVDSAWPPLHWSVKTRDVVMSVAFSPNGEHIAATCGKDVEIRSSESGSLLLTLEGHTEQTRAVAFSPDGTRIASGSGDRTIRIWTFDEGQLIFTLKGHGGRVRAVVFSPDGTRIASGSDDHTVRIWSSDVGQLLSNLEGHSGRVRAVAFSPNGACVASGSDDCTIRIWSSDNGELLSTLERHPERVNAVVFSPDGTHIASGSNDRNIHIWSSDKGQLISTLGGHTGGVNTVAFSPDGARITSGSGDRSIRIWSSDEGQILSTLEGHGGWVRAVAFSPDGTRIVSGSGDRTIRIWSSDKGGLLSTSERHNRGVHAVVFSPDGTRVASGSGDHTIRIWSSNEGRLLSALEGHRDRVRALVFSPNGTRLASGSDDCTIRIWSSDKGHLLTTLEGHTGWVYTVAFSSDSAHIVSISLDDTLRVWSSETGELIRTLNQQTHTVEDVIHSLDAGQQHDTFPPPDSSPATIDLSDEPPKLRPSWSPIRVDEKRGHLTLPSGRLLCMIPAVHLPIWSLAQFGPLLALGLMNGGLIILDFSRISHDW